VPSPVAEMFRRAASLVRDDPRRNGNVVELADAGEVIVAGDLHGNRNALSKIIHYAELGKDAARRLVLQEIIHGPADPASGKDRSIDLLVRAVRLMVETPRQVIFLMGNHDLAQATGAEILKSGGSACREFTAGVHHCFGADGDEVLDGLGEMLLALPIAVRCPNRVLLSHSLPPPHRSSRETLEVLQRPYEHADLRRGGAVYDWTWGRGQTPEQIDMLAAQLDVDFFILGHAHSPEGYELITPRCVTIASDNSSGCVVRFPTTQPLTAGALPQYIKPIAAIR